MSPLLLHQGDAVVGDLDEATFVQVADSFLVGFLAHLETGVDGFGRRLVAQLATSVVLVEIAKEHLGEVEGVTTSSGLQGEVDLSILAHMVDISRQTVARMELLEHLVVVELTLIAVGSERYLSTFAVAIRR